MSATLFNRRGVGGRFSTQKSGFLLSARCLANDDLSASVMVKMDYERISYIDVTNCAARVCDALLVGLVFLIYVYLRRIQTTT